MKKIIAIIAVLCLLAGGAYLLQADIVPLANVESITAFSSNICSATIQDEHVDYTKEFSGAVYHPGIDRLVTVDDGGKWAKFQVSSGELSQDGDWVTVDITSPDLEGVTYLKGISDSSANPDFYLLHEGSPGSIVKATWPNTFTEYKLSDCTDGGTIPNEGGNGLGVEGLTFIPDDDWPSGTCSSLVPSPTCHGGLRDGKSCSVDADCEGGSREGTGGIFVIGHQEDGKLYMVDIDFTVASTECTVVNSFGPYKVNGVVRDLDIGGLDWDLTRKELWIMYGGHGASSATIVKTSIITPGVDEEITGGCSGRDWGQEGIAIYPPSCPAGGDAEFWIAIDHNNRCTPRDPPCPDDRLLYFDDITYTCP